MDAIASGSTEVTADSLFNHFKNLTDFNRKGVEYLEEDFKVPFKFFPSPFHRAIDEKNFLFVQRIFQLFVAALLAMTFSVRSRKAIQSYSPRMSKSSILLIPRLNTWLKS